jgi:DNA repair exonuclease SbcCD nuclease subunit
MIVFAADLHLSDYTWASLPQVRGDSYRSFDQIIQWVMDHQKEVSALILGGDIFDAHPNPTAVECFLRGVRTLARIGVKMYAVQGQHGRSREIPWTSIDPHVVWLHNQTIEVEPNIWITGFDNLPPEELKDAIFRLNTKVSILVCHQKVRGSLPEIEGQQNWDFDPSWVPPFVKLVLLGDVHKTWEYSNGTQRFMYSGSICMQSMDEDPKKSFLVLDVNAGWKTFRVPLETRPFETFLILTQESLPDNLARAAKLSPDSLALVKYDARIDGVEKAFKDINKAVHFVCRPLPVELVQPEIPDQVLPHVSLETCLNQLVDPKESAKLHSFVVSLLRSPMPKDTLAKAKAEALGSLP